MLHRNLKDVVIFRTNGKLKAKENKAFVKVLGPYPTEQAVRDDLKVLKKMYGYRENPASCSRCRKISQRQIQRGIQHELEHTKSRRVSRRIACDHLREDPYYYTHLLKMEKQYKKNPVSVDNAVRITKKLVRAYEAYRKENPGQNYHDQKFIQYMKELEKYTVGSVPYIGTLAKAYEHLESAKESMR
jgi:hypothetical protein